MFRFLFGKTGTKAVKETQRQTVTRALEEINGILAVMSDKPSIAVDLNSGLIAVDLPEHMPDEALALPAPKEDADRAPEKGEDAAEEAVDKDASENGGEAPKPAA